MRTWRASNAHRALRPWRNRTTHRWLAVAPLQRRDGHAVARNASFLPIPGLPEVRPGDDLVELFDQALKTARSPDVRAGDVFVIAQKIVSKAENRYVDSTCVTPSAEAAAIAQRCLKDARLVELILRESTEVLRVAPNVLIVRHRCGFVVANAAIDQSNLPHGGERALLLPVDPDASADALRARLEQRYGVNLAVLISDSFGRAWRWKSAFLRRLFGVGVARRPARHTRSQ